MEVPELLATLLTAVLNLSTGGMCSNNPTLAHNYRHVLKGSEFMQSLRHWYSWTLHRICYSTHALFHQVRDEVGRIAWARGHLSKFPAECTIRMYSEPSPLFA